MKLYLIQLITFLYIKQEIWELAFGDTYSSLPSATVEEPRKEGRGQEAGARPGSFQDRGQGQGQGHLCRPGRRSLTGPTAPEPGAPRAGWGGEAGLGPRWA